MTDARWADLLERRGDFLYGVVTTGVYCRPDCSSKRPKRDNVRFFADGAQAEGAGFRPCKRCRPDQPRANLIAQACQTIAQAESLPALNALAAAAGLSVSQFHRLFKAATGTTPKGFAQALKRQRLQDGLRNGDSVTAALYDAGFNAPSRMYEADPVGMPPSRYRKGGAGETLHYALAPCSLGWVIAAGTARGLSVIELGDAPQALEAELHRRLPRAELTDDAEFAKLLELVVAVVDDPKRADELPLDIRGTAFQQRVWAALRAIPPGRTMCYAEIAAALGIPKACRAVGSAIASNQLAVVIPCHRVIAKDGTLAGYRWGVERKKRLLEREKG